MSFLNKVSDCKCYKILSVAALIELIVAAGVLIYVFFIENPLLRPSGTLMVSFVIACLYCVINIILALILLLEYKLRKDINTIQRTKLIHFGFVTYIVLTVISIVWALLNTIFMFV